MKRPVEIERLLQWAFRELPNRAAFGPRGAQSAWQRAQYGCPISSSPSSSAIPHRDALIIVDEVAGLRGRLAIDFDRWKAFLLGDLLPLAVGIDDPKISVSGGDLVEVHARTGVPPDWRRLPPRAKPIIERNGKPRVKGKRYGKDRYSEGAECPLRWVDLAEIARSRAEYAVWRGSLDQLVKSLNGKLKDHIASPPAALPAPWTRPH